MGSRAYVIFGLKIILPDDFKKVQLNTTRGVVPFDIPFSFMNEKVEVKQYSVGNGQSVLTIIVNVD